MASKRTTFIGLLFIITSLIFPIAAFASVAEQAELSIPKLVVNTSFLNVRSGDGPQYTVIATVVGGTELPALGVNEPGTWFLVSTPVGNGWVDVSFTLARGDFRFIPVIAAVIGADASASTPLSIGLAVPPARNFGVVSAAASTSSERGTLLVSSVNLRAQPDDAGAVITTLYANAGSEYSVVGRAFDKRFVLWAAITVANYGTGWVEADKLSFRTVEGSTVAAASMAGSTGVPVAQLGSSVIVVNTPFLNIRSGAGGQFTAIISAPGGTTFIPLGITPDLTWYLVQGDFGFGWVSSEFVLFRGDFRTVPILRDLY